MHAIPHVPVADIVYSASMSLLLEMLCWTNKTKPKWKFIRPVSLSVHLLSQNINQNWWGVFSYLFSQHIGWMLPTPTLPIVCVFAVIAAAYKSVLSLSTLLRNWQQMVQTLWDGIIIFYSRQPPLSEKKTVCLCSAWFKVPASMSVLHTAVSVAAHLTSSKEAWLV